MKICLIMVATLFLFAAWFSGLDDTQPTPLADDSTNRIAGPGTPSSSKRMATHTSLILNWLAFLDSCYNNHEKSL